MVVMEILTLDIARSARAFSGFFFFEARALTVIFKFTLGSTIIAFLLKLFL